MPQKLGKGGAGPQNYVPPGNSAGGQYGDNATGSNKHFKTFSRPKKKSTVYRGVIGGWSNKPFYYKKEDFDNPQKRFSYKIDQIDLEYDEEDTKNQIVDNMKKLLAKNPDASWRQFYSDRMGIYNPDDMMPNIDENVFHDFLKDDNNRALIESMFNQTKDNIQNKDRQERIKKGKEELAKFPKIKGPVNVEDAIVLVNKDNYVRSRNDYWSKPEEYRKYHQNCQKCVQTFELRMRGYDVEALERPTNNSTEYNELQRAGWDMSMYIMPKGGFEYYGNNWFFGEHRSRTSVGSAKPLVTTRSASQKNDIERIVKEAGNGSRFQCSVAWKGGSAHVFNIINDNGNIRFIDAQSGKNDVSYYFNAGEIKPSETMLVRVDNLEISGNVKNIAKGKKYGD